VRTSVGGPRVVTTAATASNNLFCLVKHASRPADPALFIIRLGKYVPPSASEIQAAICKAKIEELTAAARNSK
jgi:hypothetical protein